MIRLNKRRLLLFISIITVALTIGLSLWLRTALENYSALNANELRATKMFSLQFDNKFPGSIEEIEIKAAPVNSDDNGVSLRLKIENGKILNFIPAANLLSIASCGNTLSYTDNTVCVDIAKPEPFQPGETLGMLTLMWGSNGKTTLHSFDGNGYSNGETMISTNPVSISLNIEGVLPLTGSLDTNNTASWILLIMSGTILIVLVITELIIKKTVLLQKYKNLLTHRIYNMFKVIVMIVILATLIGGIYVAIQLQNSSTLPGTTKADANVYQPSQEIACPNDIQSDPSAACLNQNGYSCGSALGYASAEASNLAVYCDKLIAKCYKCNQCATDITPGSQNQVNCFYPPTDGSCLSDKDCQSGNCINGNLDTINTNINHCSSCSQSAMLACKNDLCGGSACNCTDTLPTCPKSAATFTSSGCIYENDYDCSKNATNDGLCIEGTCQACTGGGYQCSKPKISPTLKALSASGSYLCDQNAQQVCGVDISFYQGTLNFNSIEPKVKFIISRATYGLFEDSKFKRNWAGSKSADIPRSAYYFFRCEDDPVDGAKLFASLTGRDNGNGTYTYEGDFVPFIDMEDAYTLQGCNNTTLTNRTVKFMDEFHRLTNVWPGIYSRASWYDVYVTASLLPGDWAKKITEWTASYTNSISSIRHMRDWRNQYPNGNGQVFYWQYSSSGTISGIPGNNDLDGFVSPDLVFPPGTTNPPPTSPTSTPAATANPTAQPTATPRPSANPTVNPTATPSPTLTPTPVNPGAVACSSIDVNGDGRLNYIDFFAFAKVYNKTCSDTAPTNGCGGKDSNKDGKVDYKDFANFITRYYPSASNCLNNVGD